MLHTFKTVQCLLFLDLSCISYNQCTLVSGSYRKTHFQDANIGNCIWNSILKLHMFKIVTCCACLSTDLLEKITSQEGSSLSTHELLLESSALTRALPAQKYFATNHVSQ
eukprot:c24392_g5_i1 orf=190-519(+)